MSGASSEVAGLSAYVIACLLFRPTAHQAAMLKVFGGKGEQLVGDQVPAWSYLSNAPPGTVPPTHGAQICLGVLGRQCGKTDVITASLILQVALGSLTAPRRMPGQRYAIFVVGVFIEKTRKIINAVRNYLVRLGVGYDERDGELALRDFPVDIRVMPMSTVHASSDTALAIFVEDFCLATSVEGSPRQDDAFVGAVMPMLTQTRGRFFSLSQAHARDGWQWEMVEQHWGKPTSSVIAVRGATFDVVPWITRKHCLELAGGDEKKFRRHFCAQPGSNDDSLLDADDIRGCVSRGTRARPRETGIVYAAAADLAFRADNSCVAIGHRESRREADGRERDVAVLDALLVHKPTKGQPLDPEQVLAEQAALLRSYGVTRVGIDSFSRDLATARFKHFGILAEEIKIDVGAQSRRAELFMSKLRARDIELVDDEEMLRELESLRLTYRARGAISYASPARKGFHDDRADAVLALVERLQNTPSTSRGVRAETAITRSPEGHLSLRTEYFQDRRLPSGETRAVRVAPPRGTRAFDAWACRLLESGVVSSPEVGFDEWLASKLQGRDLTPATVASIIADHTFTIPVLFH